jgi:hypothetical protein
LQEKFVATGILPAFESIADLGADVGLRDLDDNLDGI